MRRFLACCLLASLTFTLTGCADDPVKAHDGSEAEIQAEAQSRLDRLNWWAPTWYKETITIRILEDDKFQLDSDGARVTWRGDLVGWCSSHYCRTVIVGRYQYLHNATYTLAVILSLLALIGGWVAAGSPGPGFLACAAVNGVATLAYPVLFLLSHAFANKSEVPLPYAMFVGYCSIIVAPLMVFVGMHAQKAIKEAAQLSRLRAEVHQQNLVDEKRHQEDLALLEQKKQSIEQSRQSSKSGFVRERLRNVEYALSELKSSSSRRRKEAVEQLEKSIADLCASDIRGDVDAREVNDIVDEMLDLGYKAGSIWVKKLRSFAKLDT